MRIPSRLILLLAPFAGTAFSQDVGTVSLPASLVEPPARVEWVQQVPSFCEGPAWDGSGSLWFTEQRGKDTADWPLWKVDMTGASAPAGSRVLVKTQQANGLAFDGAGRLLACRRRQVGRLNLSGVFETLADSSAALPFSYANDLAVGRDGAMYFTALDSLLYRIAGDGKASIVSRGHRALNGVLLDADAGNLFVGDADAGTVQRFRVVPGGELSTPKVHLRMTRPDGMCMDEMGNLYVADITEGRLRAFTPSGDSLGHVLLSPPPPWNNYKRGPNGNASNCEFGGADGRTLFITGDGGLYAVRMKVAGQPGPVTAIPFFNASAGGKLKRTQDRLQALRDGVRAASTVPGRRAGPLLQGRLLYLAP